MASESFENLGNLNNDDFSFVVDCIMAGRAELVSVVLVTPP